MLYAALTIPCIFYDGSDIITKAQGSAEQPSCTRVRIALAPHLYGSMPWNDSRKVFDPVREDAHKPISGF